METITGGAGDDGLSGTGGSDLLLGLEGDDTLHAGEGEDTLDGGAGRDRAVVDRSGDTAPVAARMLAPGQTSRVAGALLTSVEDLTFLAGSADDGAAGAGGDDSLSGGSGADSLLGGAGNDTLLGGDGADWLLGGAGADVLAGGAGADRFVLLEAGAPALGSTLAATDRIADFNAAAGDRLVLRGQAAGTALGAIATGTFAPPGGPLLPVGFGGALAPAEAPAAGLPLPDPTGAAAWLLHWLPDATPGKGGGWLVLDADRDGALGEADFALRLDLSPGAAITAADFVPVTFALIGTAAADALEGDGGDDTVLGLGGDDRLEGNAGNDAMAGGDGADTLLGGADSDTLEGGAGDDALEGGDATDLLRGGGGADLLGGGGGADLLRGEDGADTLVGGAGDDTLLGGPGADTLAGGDGADLFALREDGRPAAPGGADAVLDFDRAEGDLIRLSSAWYGLADGSGATAGTITGPDGAAARPLLFGGALAAREALAPGMALPVPRFPGLDARAVFWAPALEGGAPAGGWLLLDEDGDGALSAPDLVARFGSASSPVSLGAADFVPGTFFANEGGRVRAGTAGDDTLIGGSLGELFLGSGGSDRIEGGAGSADALSYAALAGAVHVRFTGYGVGAATKAGGGTDAFSGVHAVSGTGAADTLDGSAAGTGGLFVLSLEGGAGNDSIVGDGGHAVQATYGGDRAAALVDLHNGTADDGLGGTDALVGVRRVAVASDAHDTVLGSAQDDLFLSAGGGNKLFDGRGGLDEYRYAGAGGIAVSLTPPVFDGVTESAYALKPGGAADRLHSIEAVSGGSGDDSIAGSAADERLAGGAGDDTLDGGGGLDTVRYDVLGAGAPLPARGAVVDLAAGAAIDPWGNADALRNIEHAWGSHGADDLTGLALAGDRTWLRGGGGADTLRASAPGTPIAADHAADPGGVRADLAAGSVLDGWGDRDALVLIAHLRGSAFGDSIAGSAAANWLDGGAGDDALDGGAGADTLVGGAGDDLFVVDDAADQTLELAGEGADTVLASVAWILAPDTETLLLAGAAGIGGTGNGLANRIAGNAGANALAGGDGDDTLEGGAGDDSLSGGNDHDLLRGGDGADTLDGGAGDDSLEGGAGDDRLLGAAGADTLLGAAGADLLGGDSGGDLLDGGADGNTLHGGAGADTLEGGGGDDLLRGDAGADWLWGGADADTLEGGAENDLLFGDGGADLLEGGAGADLLDGGAGADTLDGGTENDALAGDAGADLLRGGDGADVLLGGTEADALEGGGGTDFLFGEEGHDLLRGDAGADLLEGGAEADTLEGGADGDTLRGGAGADLLRGDGGADSLDGGEEADTLEGGADADTLHGGAETDTLRGGGGADLLRGGAEGDALEGGDEADLLLGDDGADLLDGDAGDDALLGGAEADILRGGDGADLLFGEEDADLLEGGAGDDTLDGGAGDDTLDGGGGADRLHGGAGNDLFLVRDGAGIAFEGAGGGDDTVQAWATHRLNPGIETLVLMGAEDLDGYGDAGGDRITGNAGANRLAGGAGDDTLDGGAGADTLHGGEGDDVFHVRGAEDTVVEWAGQGRDTVVADSGDAEYALPAQVEALFLGPKATRGAGNGLANLMVGNGLGNTLRAGAGDDTLEGGGGDDALHGEAGADLFVFDPGMGFDRVADFQPGTDRLLLRGLGVSDSAGLAALVVDSDGGAVIDFGGGQRLLLSGVSAARLGAADALFG